MVVRREEERVEVGGERKRGVASEERKALVGGAWGEEGVGRGVGWLQQSSGRSQDLLLKVVVEEERVV